ncbi:hypothetical protein NUW58_g6748 [Xylaria curta]|uniref:Uncharacterized protein n=1 Tax=Xylaria curta TaxID=42375 RepID=A0ACC1NQJ4_9PEZI|nr:hypothetical protein NUW58_g6748 [Xylaria curta]
MHDRAEAAAMGITLSSPTPVFTTSNSQSRSVYFEEPQLDLDDYQTSKAPALNSIGTLVSWRPFYLRRAVLFGFITIFVLVIAVIESLLAVSNKNSGITTSNATQHYLWTYGPTAFLTGVAALWARVEYQSKLVAPWLQLQQNAIPTSRTLLLDYISPFSIFSLVNSWRNRDFLVLITLLVSVIIKILIIISSGLISLSLTSVTRDSYPMVLRDRFIDSNARLTTTGNLASYILHGLGPRNLTLPEGISKNYAFQSVETYLPRTAETRITVDGLTNSLNCEAANIREARFSGGAGYGHTRLTLEVALSSPGCDVGLTSLGGVGYSNPPNSTLFAKFEQVQCDTSAGATEKRVLLLFANMTYYTDYSEATKFLNGNVDYNVVGVLGKSTQLLCVPNYAIERVEVTRNGTRTNAIEPKIQGTPHRTLNSVTAWDIMDAQFRAARSADAAKEVSFINISSIEVDVDIYMELVLNWNPAPGLQATFLFDPDILQQTVEAYYRQAGAIIAKQSLMEPTRADTKGSATVNENRLIVHSWVAQWMVGLISACIFLTTIAVLLVPGRAALPRNPSTLQDLVSILQHSRELMTQLRCAGAADDRHLIQYLKSPTFQSKVTYQSISNQFIFHIIGTPNETDPEPKSFPQVGSKMIHPTILHPASRSMLCLGTVGLIISLELLLQKSNLEDGLGDVGNDTYIHYAWTAIPALVFGALSIAFSAVDFETRSLAPYVMMRKYLSKDKFSQLELLDMTIPESVYREIRLGSLWALATTTSFLIASLFTTFSASLFQESSLPFKTSVVLGTNQSFLLTPDNWFDRSSSSQATSLILASNYSFPRFTYQNLAFPELIPISTTSYPHSPNESTLSISATVPAVRGYMDCRSYESTQIYANLTLNYTDESTGETNPLKIRVDEETCGDPDSIVFSISTAANVTYIGQVAGSAVFWGRCSDLLYFWGKIDHGSSPAIQHISALGCNVSFQSVDVDTTFIGTDLDLDLQNPPRPLESTLRNSTLSKSDRRSPLNSYVELADAGAAPQLLDNFFSLLVTSPWAIPVAALGDPSASPNISAAIKFHHSIFLAQELATKLAPANETNATLAEPIVDSTSRRRVVQDAASTHILAALLAAALILFVLGWVFGPSTSVLPRNPTTIASAIALLAGGNLFAHLPSNGSWLSPEEIAAMLGDSDARFWMGWGNLPDEEGMLTGGENELACPSLGSSSLARKRPPRHRPGDTATVSGREVGKI